MPHETSPALVATLGLQPQVITRALDLLIQQQEPELGEAVIIYTAAYRAHPDWKTFAEFQRYVEGHYVSIHWRWTPIKPEHAPDSEIVYDVETPEKAELTWRTIYREIKRLAQAGRRIHGLIAGGRKSMIVYTMLSAQILFDPDDRLWHLFSADEGPEPHLSSAQQHRSQLIEIPVIHMAGLMPVVRQLILNSDDPTTIIDFYQEQHKIDYIFRLRRFYEEACDEHDRQILLLAYQGFSNSQIAEQVFLAEGRVSARINDVANRFYESFPDRRPNPPFPGRLRLRLLHDMRPFLSRLTDG